MDPLKVGKPAPRKIKPTPVYRKRKYSWAQICEMRQLWAHGEGLSVREIADKFNIGCDYLRQILWGLCRTSEDPDRGNPACFVNEVSDMPVQFLTSPDGELFRRRNSGRCRIRPSIPARTVALIREGRRQGKRVSDLAVMYGVTIRHVYRILAGKTRKEG